MSTRRVKTECRQVHRGKLMVLTRRMWREFCGEIFESEIAPYSKAERRRLRARLPEKSIVDRMMRNVSREARGAR